MSVLSKPIEDTPIPQPLPDGEYIFEIRSYKLGETRSDEPKETVTFYLRPVEVVEVFDGTDVDLETGLWNTVEDMFFLTDRALPILMEFLDKRLGIDITDGKTWTEAFEESIGLAFRGVTKQRTVETRQGNERTYVDIKRRLRMDSV